MQAVRGIFCFAVSISAAATPNLVGNGGFETNFKGWVRWGKNANLITLAPGVFHTGTNSAQLQHGHNALYFVAPMHPGKTYELRFFYRLEGDNPAADVSLGFSTKGGALGSAGYEVFRFSVTNNAAPAWTEFRKVFLPSAKAATCQFAFHSGEGTTFLLDDVSLRVVPRPAGLTPPPEPWAGLRQRKTKPLFKELLGQAPGNYTVVCWAHDLHRQTKSGAFKSEEIRDDAKWQKEVALIFQESGEAGMGFLDLSGQLDRSEPWLTKDFHRRQFEKYGVRYDVWSEGGVSVGEALKNGAELLNPSEVALEKRPAISLVDPKYVEAQSRILQKLGEQLRGENFVGHYYGRDEPMIHLPEGKPERWGSYGQTMAREVLEKYGFGKFAAPQPHEKEFQKDPNQPLRWIAYHRWANDRFAETRGELYRVLHEADPKASYTGADYWFMSGFVPYDYSQLSRSADLMELDPYASSAEIRRGRGVFNHSFGAKFMRDLTGKPVRIIAQAFDYKGYDMTPDDLREWVSQALRGGASAIDYYTLDSPRWTHRDRWKMMLHLSQTVTRMNRLELPAEADTAILYTVYTHMSLGSSTDADQLYAAHALLGEMAGSWFQFVSDTQLERGERALEKYKAVYLPLARFMTAEATAKIEEYVRGGGTLICGDAEAFSFDLSGKDTSAVREKFFGGQTVAPKHAEKIILSTNSSAFRQVLNCGSPLPLYDLELWDETSPGRAREIKITADDVEILGRFADGSPAVISRKLGQGRVILFAANPFSPLVVVEKTAWPAFFKNLQQSLGCRVDLPIWRFQLPAPSARLKN